MKIQMRLRCHTIVVMYFVVFAIADQDVKSDNVIPARTSRVSQSFKPYSFRPRAIPLKTEATPKPEQNKYYTQDSKYKTEILFPGNYFAIPKEKSTIKVEDAAYNPLVGGQFEPKAIPLIRGQGYAKRSLDLTEPIEKTEELVDQASQRRSLSYILGEAEADEDDEDEDGEYEVEETEDVDGDGVESKHKVGGGHIGHKIKHKAKRAKKFNKYMMPLLLAYKLKYLAIVPVMLGGLVLLVGATGLAGFFFALFAAVMGLQKGGY